MKWVVSYWSKGTNFSIIRGINSEDLMYNMVAMSENTLLYNWNLLREFKCSYKKEK